MEGAGSNEEDVVGFDRTILGLHDAAFDDRQNVALYAFAGNAGAAAVHIRFGDLVDLVDKDDAVVFRQRDGFLCHEVFVDELFRFLFGENVPRFGDGHTFFLFLRWHDVFHHIVHIIHDLVHAGCGEHVVGHVLFFNLDLDDLVVKFVAAQLFLEDHLLVVAAPFFFGIGGAVALLLGAEEHLKGIVPAALLFL